MVYRDERHFDVRKKARSIHPTGVKSAHHMHFQAGTIRFHRRISLSALPHWDEEEFAQWKHIPMEIMVKNFQTEGVNSGTITR